MNHDEVLYIGVPPYNPAGSPQQKVIRPGDFLDPVSGDGRGREGKGRGSTVVVCNQTATTPGSLNAVWFGLFLSRGSVAVVS